MPMSGEEFVEWLDRELEPLRREATWSLYFDAWCSGDLSKEQVFELMKQRYAYLREIPHIIAAWIERCPYVEVRQKYIDYLHEEAPHPEYLVEVAAANNFGNERTNTRKGKGVYEATVKYYPYPSLIKFFEDHAEEEGEHANLGVYVLKNYATTEELQRKATQAAKKSLQLKILGQNALWERFIKNWQGTA